MEISRSRYGFVVTFILCLLAGWLGMHRFYTGRLATGFLMLLTLGGFGLWMLADLLQLILGNFRDAHSLPVRA